MLDLQTPTGFDALNLPRELCSLLNRHGIVTPTPIQEQAIPIAMSGRDLIGVANTGTGKTLAFGLPMILRLKQYESGLVIAPTRELAQQIAETYNKLGTRCVLVVGGASMGTQIHELRQRYAVIVATPGRLIDHMDRGTVDLRNVGILVLDEADRMLDMGFAPAIKRIIEKVPTNRQTMLFSATMPNEIQDLAASYMRNAQRIEISQMGSTPDSIRQELVIVPFDEKQPVLQELLYQHRGTVLVFTRTRHGARKIAKAVRTNGHTAAELHADRTLAQRRTALQGFKEGEYRVLVATDIAARGIDVKDISLVVNYDVPENPEDYIHRIGRTGRAGAPGHSITIALPQQSRAVRDIEKLIGSRITVVSGTGDTRPNPTPVKAVVETPRDRVEQPQESIVRRQEPSRPRNDRPARPYSRENRSSEGDRSAGYNRSDANSNRPAPRREDRPSGNDRTQGYNRDNRPGSNSDRPYSRDNRPEQRRDDRPRPSQDRKPSNYREDRPQTNGDARSQDRPRPANRNDRPAPSQDRREPKNDRWRDDRPRPNGGPRSYDRPTPSQDRAPQAGRQDGPYTPPKGVKGSGPIKPKHAARKALAPKAENTPRIENTTPGAKPGHRGWSGKPKKQARGQR